MAFKRRQNPLNEWIYEADLKLGDVLTTKCSTLYKQFIAWCEENGYSKLMTSFTFKEDICALYGTDIKLEAVPNSSASIQIFVKNGDYDKDFKPL